LPHIFERFYRVDPSRSRSTGGAGIGLTIVKAIVDAHGGRIDVFSQVGQGTKFIIELPSYPLNGGDSYKKDI
jgi:signal transduction histidine kinase